MSEFEQIQSGLARLRAERRRSEERLRAVMLRRRALDAKAPAGEEETGPNELDSQLADAKRAYDEARLAELEQSVALTDTSPMEQVEQLDDSIPFLLFPVRIETRFMERKAPGSRDTRHQLWVRFYPDDIQIDTHEPQLTESEVRDARTYWNEVWKSGPSEVGRLGAWRALVDSIGPNRATWVVEAYVPLNSNDILNATTAEDPLLNPTGYWPDYEAKPDAWSRPPVARLMPDRFVVSAYIGGRKVVEVTGNLIADPLVVGMDPDPVDDDQSIEVEGDAIRVSADMQWMVDFDEAVRAGMGVRIDITDEQARSGFDRLLVLGLRLSDDSDTAGAAVESLLKAHRHSPGGFSLVPVGTPTNNTSESESGFSTFESGAETSFDLMAHGQFSETDDWKSKSDGQRLAEWLGIASGTLAHVEHSGGTDARDARAMNTALWPATLGYFMEEMMARVISAEDRADTRDFFIQYVSGRGPASAIRIGTQPYGILPATAWSRLTLPSDQNVADESFEDRLKSILDGMSRDWESMAADVSYTGKDGDPYETLLDIIGLHASTAEIHQRTAVGAEYLTNYLNLGSRHLTALHLMGYWSSQGQRALAALGYAPDALPEIFEKTFFAGSTLLDGPVVDDVPLSESDPIRTYSADGQNYIRWILDSSLDAIRSEDFGPDHEAPTALLYLLLRHAAMLSYWDGAMLLHAGSGNLDSGDRKETELLHISTGDETLGKWDYLYTPNSVVTGDTASTLATYLDPEQA